ncbi:MAG: aminodeoxychorismate lyase [Betaproteobacteria bacterium]|nr:aminodeoxychorismate lyase [Betaproteobacteria bacterium]
MMTLINGLQTEHIRVFDRGLLYGDGVFRTMLVKAGRLLCWQRHYEKLRGDCAAIGIECPSREILTEEISEAIKETPDCVLKAIVTRGEGQRGYAVQQGAMPTRILIASPIPQYPSSHYSEGIRLHLCKTRLALQPSLAGIKHLNRLENILARQEWSDPEITEGLMLDMKGNVIEGTMSNLFLLQGDTLYTPDLGDCGVAGMQRARIMEMAGRLGMAVKVEKLALARVYAADEMVLCNSVIGAWQVRELAEKIWSTGGLAMRLRSFLDDDGY